MDFAPRVLGSPAEDDTPALTDPSLLAELEASLARLQDYAGKSRTQATVRAYKSDWADFSAWCARYDLKALPAHPETIGLYLGSVAEQLSLATLERRLAAIAALHKEAGYESPATVSQGPLRRIWKGLVREKSRRQDKAEPLLVADLRRMMEHLPRETENGKLTLVSLRDRAILLIGWAGALRRSEIVGLRMEDIEYVGGEGVNIYIRQSKTDQVSEGLLKGIPYGSHAVTCPVLALRTWIHHANISEGPIFRRFYRGGKIGNKALSAQYVSLILKKYAEKVGLDPEKFSAHSLRSGFITQAIRKGKSERRIKEHSGHKSWDTFNRYVKRAGTFQSNPVKDVGL